MPDSISVGVLSPNKSLLQLHNEFAEYLLLNSFGQVSYSHADKVLLLVNFPQCMQVAEILSLSLHLSPLSPPPTLLLFFSLQKCNEFMFNVVYCPSALRSKAKHCTIDLKLSCL